MRLAGLTTLGRCEEQSTDKLGDNHDIVVTDYHYYSSRIRSQSHH
jgi:hypothetical protein